MAGLFDGAARLPGILGDPRFAHLFQPMGGPPNANMNLQPMTAPPNMEALRPEPGRFAGVGKGLGGAFGGMDDPRLSPAENKRARNQAIMEAGLATIIAASQPGASGLSSIAQGALYGQQAGAAGREGAFQQGQTRQAEADKKEQMARLREAVGRGEIDRPALERLFVAAITSGDSEAAGRLSEVLKSMGGNQTSLPSQQLKEGINPATGKPEQYRFNQQTGEIAWVGVSPIVSPTSTGSDIQQQRVFTRENSLRDDYRTEVRDTETAYKFIDNALNKRTDAKAGNPAAQVALLYGFVKAMDPNSVVREGEIALAGAAAPLWSRAQAVYADVVQGKSPAIPPAMVDQMADFMEQMQTEKETHWSSVYDNYTDSASRWGVDPAAFRKPPEKYRNRRGATAPTPGRFGNLVPGGG